MSITNEGNNSALGLKPGVMDELATERTKLLERESAELQQEADKLADEIKELSAEGSSRIN